MCVCGVHAVFVCVYVWGGVHTCVGDVCVWGVQTCVGMCVCVCVGGCACVCGGCVLCVE